MLPEIGHPELLLQPVPLSHHRHSKKRYLYLKCIQKVDKYTWYHDDQYSTVTGFKDYSFEYTQ